MMKRHSSSSQNVDRISYLPEPIRSHIVSFLPLKYAIRTSILSKRWNDICSSLSNFDFNQFEFPRQSEKECKEIIDQILFLHNGSDLQNLRLCVNIDGEHIAPLHINRWVSFALRRNVLQLALYIAGKLEKLPYSLFTSRSLKVLKLSGIHMKMPSIIQLPVLKTLKLVAVTFYNEYLTNKLFSDTSCPVVENLNISYCNLDHFSTISISISSLRILKIKDGDDDEGHALKFKLSNQNLHEICYVGSELPDLSFEILQSLLTATFELVSLRSTSDAMGNLASKILMGLRSVDTLKLRGEYIEVLTRVRDISACLPTSCRGLKHLYLCMHPTKNQLQLVTLLSSCFPNLETLYVYFLESNIASLNMLSVETYWQSKDICTSSISKHLQAIEIVNFDGGESEIEFLRYLTENARFLKEMKISFLVDTYEESWMEISDKLQHAERKLKISAELLALSRVSPCAKIYVS